MNPPIRAAVLTVSDRSHRGERPDASGPALCAILQDRLGAEVVHTACVSDDIDPITTQLRAWSGQSPPIDLALTTGGTGLAPRDNTPEAAAKVITRLHPGLLELARMRCYQKTPRTYLSRGISGAAGRTLIITLPGSPRGATEMLEAMLDVLPHAIETLRGDVRDG